MHDPESEHPLLVVAFGSKVFALDRHTGEIRWRVVVDMGRSLVELAIDSSTVIACSSSAIVFIDYETGEVRKSITREDKVKNSSRPLMVIEGDQLFLANEGQAACYSLDGELLWENGFKGEGYGQAALGFPDLVRQADLDTR